MRGKKSVFRPGLRILFLYKKKLPGGEGKRKQFINSIGLSFVRSAGLFRPAAGQMRKSHVGPKKMILYVDRPAFA